MRESGRTISEIEFPSNVIPLRASQPISGNVAPLKHNKDDGIVDGTHRNSTYGYSGAIPDDLREWALLIEVIGEQMTTDPSPRLQDVGDRSRFAP